MNRSRFQTAVVLVVGLVVAVTVYFWQDAEEQGAVPAPAPTTSMESQPTETATSAAPSATPTPSPELTPTPSPFPGAADQTSPTPAYTAEALQAVQGLRIAENTARAVIVRWDAVPGAEGYVVYLNGNRISSVAEQSATILWDIDRVDISIAASAGEDIGPSATVHAVRPVHTRTRGSGEPTTRTQTRSSTGGSTREATPPRGARTAAAPQPVPSTDDSTVAPQPVDTPTTTPSEPSESASGAAQGPEGETAPPSGP